MAEIPQWLLTMRSVTGVKEAAGAADDPRIMGWATRIAQVFPETRGYLSNYTGDEVAWCGLAVAFCMCEAGYKPAWGVTDIDKFLWARSWANWGHKLASPQQGCVVVMTREGGGHVTLLEEEKDGSLLCRGGNQSDSVNVSTFPKSSVLAYVWPSEAPLVPTLDPASMPLVKMGDTGSAVTEAQRLLGGIEVDGEFGPATDAAVRQFQAANNLTIDGEVGPETWGALYGDRAVEDDLTQAQVSEVSQLAIASPIGRYNWKDRGVAPPGYIKGLAVTYAYVYKQFKAGDSAAKVMAQAAGSGDKDALTWLGDEFQAIGMSIANPGVDNLRALFTLMYGLGMRESSGRYCTGRDQSATNTTADTCEAGLFQTSFNAAAAHAEMRKLFDTYSNEPGETGFLEVFREKVTCSSADWQNYGSGDGAKYQELSKRCPAFHCEFTAVGLRTIRKHWGPVNRKELELRKDAADLLRSIEILIDKKPPVVEPPVPLSWAEKTTAAIVEAIAPVILEVLENSLPPATLTRTTTREITAPMASPVAVEVAAAPIEERQADWSDVAAAVMPRLTQQQALDIFMQMLRPQENPPPPPPMPQASVPPPPAKKKWFS